MSRSGGAEVVFLGSRLHRKDRRRWRRVEVQALGHGPFYIPGRIPRSRKNQESGFFLLRCGGRHVGQAAAEIRAFRKPNVYDGKGIRYRGEQVIQKAGKLGGPGAAG